MVAVDRLVFLDRMPVVASQLVQLQEVLHLLNREVITVAVALLSARQDQKEVRVEEAQARLQVAASLPVMVLLLLPRAPAAPVALTPSDSPNLCAAEPLQHLIRNEVIHISSFFLKHSYFNN